jgi:type II/IV secretion system protein
MTVPHNDQRPSDPRELQPLWELLPTAIPAPAVPATDPSPAAACLPMTRPCGSPKPLSPTPRPSASNCPLCGGTAGDFLTTTAIAQARRLIVLATYTARALVICPQCPAGQARAQAWSGLPTEAMMIQLDSLRAVPAQAAAIAALTKLLAAPRGWLTLVGPYGTGKTTMLYAALNYLAALGVFGIYTTAPMLLDQLRDALRDADGRPAGVPPKRYTE